MPHRLIQCNMLWNLLQIIGCNKADTVINAFQILVYQLHFILFVFTRAIGRRCFLNVRIRISPTGCSVVTLHDIKDSRIVPLHRNKENKYTGLHDSELII
jgi:hypothetical protein